MHSRMSEINAHHNRTRRQSTKTSLEFRISILSTEFALKMVSHKKSCLRELILMLESLCRTNQFQKKHFTLLLFEAITKIKEKQYNIHTFEILPFFRIDPRYLIHPINSLIFNLNEPYPPHSIIHTLMSDYPNYTQIYTEGSRNPVKIKSGFEIYISGKTFILLLELFQICTIEAMAMLKHR